MADQVHLLLDGDTMGNKLTAVVEGEEVRFQTTTIEVGAQGLGTRVKTRYHFTLSKGQVLALAEILQGGKTT